MDARLAALEAELQWLERENGQNPHSGEEIEQVYGKLIRRLARVPFSNQEERESLLAGWKNPFFNILSEVDDVDAEKLVRECDVALQIVRARVRNLVVEGILPPC